MGRGSDLIRTTSSRRSLRPPGAWPHSESTGFAMAKTSWVYSTRRSMASWVYSTRRSMAQSKLSVQLYSVREELQDDLLGTLRRIAEIGFTNVEPYDFTAFMGLGSALTAAGLCAPTAHMRFIGKDPAPIFEAARQLGIGTVIDPHVNEVRWQTVEDIAGIAADFNHAAKVAGEYGLVVGYHNHAMELESVIDGTPALELFSSLLDEQIVLELDTYWAAVGGQDPIKLLGRLGKRVTALPH